MIYVDRSRVAKPSLFESRPFKVFVDELTDFNLRGGTRATQERFAWERRLAEFADRAVPALHQLFYGKCAYTEAPVGDILEGGKAAKTMQMQQSVGSDEPPLSGLLASLVLHRPPGDAIGMRGKPWPLHYWWLIPEWTNWYLADPRVVSVKANQFPVAGQRTIPPSARPVPIEPLDDGILLDPCRDEPTLYLEFQKSGIVVNRPFVGPEHINVFGSIQRGDETIRILDLNNDRLVKMRSRAVSRLTPVLRSSSVDKIVEFIDPRRVFVAAQRQAVADRCIEQMLDGDDRLVEMAGEHVPVELVATLMARGKPLSKTQLDWLKPAIEHVEARFADAAESAPFNAVFRGKRARVAVPKPARKKDTQPVVFQSARLVEARIRNFKAVKDVSLRISHDTIPIEPRFDDEESPTIQAVGWKALLGENGSGKSCLLEALGLALSGGELPMVMEQAGLLWSKILRRPADSDEKVKQGRVFLKFTGDVKIDLRFNKRRHWWVGGVPDMQAYVRGYGATRLLDSGTQKLDYLRQKVRVANLYDPRAPVIDAEQWLLGLPEADFNVAAITIDDLLGHPRQKNQTPISEGEPVIRRVENQVLVDGDPLDLVSDGYRAVIAIACDIIAGLGAGLSTMHSATGMVLIDEIGAHLHPSWRMAITETLRRALPNVQFVVSTHEPLCLRGLREREVIRIRKTSELGVTLEEIERSPSDYRVDQLLTSEFFGMDTTIDPELEARFQAYYRLLAVPEDKRTAEQKSSLIELKRYIDRNSKPVLGHTRRDQLVYLALDEFLSEAGQLSPEDRSERRRKALDRVRDIWEMRRGGSSHFSGGR